MADVTDGLRSLALALLDRRGFLRLSRDEGALYATDLLRRVPKAEAERCLSHFRERGWHVRTKGDLCLLTPGLPLLSALCPAPSSGKPWSRDRAFADLLSKYAQDTDPDMGFALCLLRAIELARLGNADALDRVKRAYALALAEGKAVRTPLTAALADALAGTLAERNRA